VTSSPEFRAIRPDERGDVLDHWLTVWGSDGRAYFRAYLEGDPWFQDRYCQAAVADGRIVSVVIICKRPVRMGSRTLVMGGIGNVATLREYRRRGYSGELLDRCVRVMEEDGFDFSALGTGIHRHYERHGWFRVETSHPEVRLSNGVDLPAPDAGVQPLSAEEWLREGPEVYRAFLEQVGGGFERSREYWEGWIRIRASGEDEGRNRLIGLRPEGKLAGYLAASLPRDPEGSVHVHEYAVTRLSDIPRVIAEAARIARSAGVKRLSVTTPRLPVLDETLAGWGETLEGKDSGTMLRRVRADEATMAEVVRAYEGGRIAWWGVDGF
jgi:GNAT superfamily N-acetyltransferase